MQQTYQINTEDLNSNFLEMIKIAFGKSEVRISVEDIKTKEEQERFFKSAFGSWAGEETAEELVRVIYSSRSSSTRDIDL